MFCIEHERLGMADSVYGFRSSPCLFGPKDVEPGNISFVKDMQNTLGTNRFLNSEKITIIFGFGKNVLTDQFHRRGGRICISN